MANFQFRTSWIKFDEYLRNDFDLSIEETLQLEDYSRKQIDVDKKKCYLMMIPTHKHKSNFIKVSHSVAYKHSKPK